MNIFIITALFAPLLCFVTHLSQLHGMQLDVWSLHWRDHAMLLGLLLMPALALKQLQLFRAVNATPHPME